MTDLEWLAAWVRDQRDPTWLQRGGVRLESLENPGWRLEISLVGTALERRATEGIFRADGEPSRDEAGRVVLIGKAGHRYTACGESWFVCGAEAGVFLAAGDPTRLPDVVRAFRDWATSG